MEENLHILREIGAQQIHKDTHISKEYVQAIIHGSFDGMSSVQLNGFISILEKEYRVDLSELKREAARYFVEEVHDSANPSKIFVTSQREKNNTQMYVWVGVIVFLAVLYYSFGYVSSESSVEQETDNSLVENVQEIVPIPDTQELDVVAVTQTTEVKAIPEEEAADVVVEAEALVATVAAEEIILEETPVQEVKTLKILPVNKIWAGYINIKTNAKRQKVFKKEFALDVEKDWLLLFGEGTVYLEVNSQKKKFSSRKIMRFKYVDGKFEKITTEEFKSLNKGSKW